MKIYTRTGDDGTTGLIGGSRVLKSDQRIEAYGTLDELNASIGCAAVIAKSPLLEQLRRVQGELFVIGSQLATLPGSGRQPSLPSIKREMVQTLEEEMDQAETTLPPLRNFILPGGGEAAARLHVARTVCRRAERLIVGSSIEHPDRPLMIEYLNRLSDWLFVQARSANQREGIADIPWIIR